MTTALDPGGNTSNNNASAVNHRKTSSLSSTGSSSSTDELQSSRHGTHRRPQSSSSLTQIQAQRLLDDMQVQSTAITIDNQSSSTLVATSSTCSPSPTSDESFPATSDDLPLIDSQPTGTLRSPSLTIVVPEEAATSTGVTAVPIVERRRQSLANFKRIGSLVISDIRKQNPARPRGGGHNRSSIVENMLGAKKKFVSAQSIQIAAILVKNSTLGIYDQSWFARSVGWLRLHYITDHVLFQMAQYALIICFMVLSFFEEPIWCRVSDRETIWTNSYFNYDIIGKTSPMSGQSSFSATSQLVTPLSNPTPASIDDMESCGSQLVYQRSGVRLLPINVSLGLELVMLVSLLGTEVLLKCLILGFRSELRRDKSLLFMLLFFLISIVDVLFSLGGFIQTQKFRLSPLCRPILFVGMLPNIRARTIDLIKGLPAIFDILVLLWLLLFLYAWIGIILFHPNNSLMGAAYLQDFLEALWQFQVQITTSNSPEFMLPAYRLHRIWLLLFVSLFIFGTYFLMPLILANIFNGYSKQHKESIRQFNDRKMKGLHDAFLLLDCEKNGEISFSIIMRLLLEMLGFDQEAMDQLQNYDEQQALEAAAQAAIHGETKLQTGSPPGLSRKLTRKASSNIGYSSHEDGDGNPPHLLQRRASNTLESVKEEANTGSKAGRDITVSVISATTITTPGDGFGTANSSIIDDGPQNGAPPNRKASEEDKSKMSTKFRRMAGEAQHQQIPPIIASNDHYLAAWSRAKMYFDALDHDRGGTIDQQEFQQLCTILAMNLQSLAPPILPPHWAIWHSLQFKQFTNFVRRKWKWNLIMFCVVVCNLAITCAETIEFRTAPQQTGSGFVYNAVCKKMSDTIEPADVSPVPLIAHAVLFESLQLICLFMYILDVCFKILCLGWNDYQKNKHYLFEMGFTFFALASELCLMIPYLACMEEVYGLVLVLRLLRTLRLLSHITRFRLILSTFWTLLPRFAVIVGMILAVYYFFAHLGIMIFGGKLYLGNPDLLKSALYDANNYYSITFNDFGASVSTLFVLMLLSNWHFIVDGFVCATSRWARIFFLSFYYICVLMVLNLCVAFVLDSFITEWTRAREENHQRLKRKKRLRREKLAAKQASIEAAAAAVDSGHLSKKEMKQLKKQQAKEQFEREEQLAKERELVESVARAKGEPVIDDPEHSQNEQDVEDAQRNEQLRRLMEQEAKKQLIESLHSGGTLEMGLLPVVAPNHASMKRLGPRTTSVPDLHAGSGGTKKLNNQASISFAGVGGGGGQARSGVDDDPDMDGPPPPSNALILNRNQSVPVENLHQRTYDPIHARRASGRAALPHYSSFATEEEHTATPTITRVTSFASPSPAVPVTSSAAAAATTAATSTEPRMLARASSFQRPLTLEQGSIPQVRQPMQLLPTLEEQAHAEVDLTHVQPVLEADSVKSELPAVAKPATPVAHPKPATPVAQPIKSPSSSTATFSFLQAQKPVNINEYQLEVQEPRAVAATTAVAVTTPPPSTIESTTSSGTVLLKRWTSAARANAIQFTPQRSSVAPASSFAAATTSSSTPPFLAAPSSVQARIHTKSPTRLEAASMHQTPLLQAQIARARNVATSSSELIVPPSSAAAAATISPAPRVVAVHPPLSPAAPASPAPPVPGLSSSTSPSASPILQPVSIFRSPRTRRVVTVQRESESREGENKL